MRISLSLPDQHTGATASSPTQESCAGIMNFDGKLIVGSLFFWFLMVNLESEVFFFQYLVFLFSLDNVFLVRSCTFSQTLTSCEATNAGSDIGFLRLTAVKS